MLSPDESEQLIVLKDQIVEKFSAENWLELGTLLGSPRTITGHSRLLRSLSFGDEDYAGSALSVLLSLLSLDATNLDRVQRYVDRKFPIVGEFVSSAQRPERTIVFAPSVFSIPDSATDPTLVSVMMPFGADLRAVYDAIGATCRSISMSCTRADDIWENSTVIQDVFDLIFRSSIVICDFTGRNPNVFYEAGIAHTLGKHVVPITQSDSDIPFDLKHHRYLKYINNNEGLYDFTKLLRERLLYLQRG